MSSKSGTTWFWGAATSPRSSWPGPGSPTSSTQSKSWSNQIERDNLRPEEVENLRREVSIHRELNHPNIIKLYNFFETGKQIFLLLEYLPQGNLYDYMKGRTMDDHQVARIFRDVMLGVHYLHARKIFHRDIKPENVLLDGQGNFKLCDFGFSAIFGNGENRKTLCGTKEYLAPEVISSDAQDDKVDIWCMGVLLFELVHKRPPYACKNIMTLYNEIKMRRIQFRSNINPDFKKIIEMCLQFEPSYRPTAEYIVESFPWLQDGLSRDSHGVDAGSGQNRARPKPAERTQRPNAPNPPSSVQTQSLQNIPIQSRTVHATNIPSSYVNVYTNLPQSESERVLHVPSENRDSRGQQAAHSSKPEYRDPRVASQQNINRPSNESLEAAHGTKYMDQAVMYHAATNWTNAPTHSHQTFIRAVPSEEEVRRTNSLLDNMRPRDQTPQYRSNNAPQSSHETRFQAPRIVVQSQKNVVLRQSPSKQTQAAQSFGHIETSINRQANPPSQHSFSPAPRPATKHFSFVTGNDTATRIINNPSNWNAQLEGFQLERTPTIKREEPALSKTLPSPHTSSNFQYGPELHRAETSRNFQQVSGFQKAPVVPSHHQHVVNIYRRETNETHGQQPNIYKNVISSEFDYRQKERMPPTSHQRIPAVTPFQVTSTPIPQKTAPPMMYQKPQTMSITRMRTENSFPQQPPLGSTSTERRLQNSSSVPRRIQSIQHHPTPPPSQPEIHSQPMTITKIIHQTPQVSRTREVRSTSAQIGEVRSVRYINYH